MNDEEDPSKLNSFQINKSFSRHSIGVSNRSIDNDEADQPELQFEKTLHEKYEDQVEKSELLRHRSDVLDAIIDLDISQRMSILTEKILKSGWSMNK